MANFDNINPGTTPDDPGAETIYSGAQKIKTFIEAHEASTNGTVTASPHEMPLDGNRVEYFATTTLAAGASRRLTVPASPRPGTVAHYFFDCAEDGQVSFESGKAVRVNGEIRGGFLNYVKVSVVGSADASTTITVDVVNMPKDTVTGETLVFWQDLSTVQDRTSLLVGQDEFAYVNEGVGTPTSVPKYSILGDLEKYRAPDGYFYFKVEYLISGTVAARLEFRQASNPLDPTKVYEVDGYTNYVSLPGISGGGIGFTGGGMAVGGFNLARNTAYAEGSLHVRTSKTAALSAQEATDTLAFCLVGLRESWIDFAASFGLSASTYPGPGLTASVPVTSINQCHVYALRPQDLTTPL